MTERLRFPRSLERRLPALIAVTVVVLALAVSLAAYRLVGGVLLAAAGVRLDAAAGQVAGLLAESGKRLLEHGHTFADDPAVRGFVEGRGNAAAVRQRLRSESQVVRLEVRDADGTLLLAAGDSGGAVPERFATLARIGRMRAADTLVHYDVTVPVPGAETEPAGWVVLTRRLSAARSGEAIEKLIGADATLRVGNQDGSLWTDLTHVASGPAPDLIDRGPIESEDSAGSKLGTGIAVDGTPWVVWLSAEQAALLEPARRFLRSMLPVAALLVLAALGVTWWFSRRITAPLRQLSDAAGAVSAGDYSRRVAVSRSDELGVLGESFNVMAERVERMHADLEREVAERTSALSATVEELKTAQAELVRQERLAMLGQLASSVGHELRNPLGVMTNAVFYIDAVLGNAPAEVREYLGILRHQISTSEKIIGDLLDFARVKPPQREVVDLPQLLDEQLGRLGSLEGIDVRREFDDAAPAWIDRVQIGQVALNLLSNAVQAMGEGGGRLTLRVGRDGPGRVRLAVTDTGAGIPAENLERIFEPLFTTRARGIGLGLSVSRSLVHANGGELTVSSEDARGSTFTVLLPEVQGAAR